MFVQAYLNTAQQILNEYQGEEPFHSFLKKYFGANKKFGSHDRKHIAHLCYCFFRLGSSLKEVSTAERILIGLFLCNNSKSLLLEKLNAGLNDEVEKELAEKLKKVILQYGFEVEKIFSFHQALSDDIEYYPFSLSFLIQPDAYLRIRPGYEKEVTKKLSEANIAFSMVTDQCLSVGPATKLNEVLEINKEVVVQDLSSQQVLNSLKQHSQKRQIKTAWDCCAASGGKTILLKDHFPNLQLTVSDIRESILINLKKRFEQAGITGYKKMVADISNASLNTEQKFDLIICDAPCSGSGTWSRTPEQLYFFDGKKIEHYSALQKKILSSAVKSLKKDGFLLYITCSVFKNENEEVVKFISEQLSLQLLNMEYLKGYNQKADTLFTALFVL